MHKPTLAARAQASRNAKSKLRSVRIEKADNGGFTVSHEHDSGDSPYRPPTTHVFGDAGAMLSHVGSTFGGGESKAEEAKEPPAERKAEKHK